MKQFVITISDEALEILRKRLPEPEGWDKLSDAAVIHDLFYIDDRGENDIDVRSEVSVTPV